MTARSDRVRVERLLPADAGRFADLRRRALATDPDAFFATLAEEEALSVGDRARELERVDRVWLAAVDGGGRDVGLAAALPAHDGPGLEVQVVSVWVQPAARGAGVASALTAALVEHARSAGVRGVRLWVADGNEAAVRLYAEMGFEPTGRTGTFPPPRSHPEHERRLALS